MGMFSLCGSTEADGSGGQAARTLDGRGREYVTLSADHSSQDARIATLLLAAQRRYPLVLIAGDGYALLPWDLGCTYAVLGWCAPASTLCDTELTAGTGSRRLGTNQKHVLQVSGHRLGATTSAASR